jgi:hypothetical protein
MTWNDISVWQWQQLQMLHLKKDADSTDLDLAVKALCILKNYSEEEVDSFSLERLRVELKSIDFFTNSQPEPKPVDVIKVNGRRYRCIYDIRNLPTARYLETKYFANDVVFNLHRIGASMVSPIKFTWRGFKVCNYDASKHEDYANDLLEAKFVEVYGSVVFFCQVFKNSIESSKDYLMKEIQKNPQMKQVEKLVEILWQNLDGFTKLPSLPSMKKLS